MKRIVLGFLLAAISPAALHAAQAEPAGRQALQDYVATLAGERKEAGAFLLDYLPASDAAGLPLALFRENLEQAFAAREKYPWTKALAKDRFFDDVLPHAVADETRDSWRKQLRELFDPLLADCRNVTDAARIVGSNITKLTGVKYDTKREKACQSPAESMRQGMASCTGLSILMVDALRAVGVPARLVAIPLWGTMEGNHTWVEIQDGQGWQMAGYGGSPDEWNKGWEIARCAYSDPAQPITGIYASSYRSTDIGFPTVWDWEIPRNGNPAMSSADVCKARRETDGSLAKLEWTFQKIHVPGIDRTAHYIEMAGGRKTPIPKGMAAIPVRACLTGTETRVDVPVRMFRDGERVFEGRTASQSQDLNDYVRIVCPPGNLKLEYLKAGHEWVPMEVNAVADKETPVRIEVTAAEAAGVFTVNQRQDLATWFRSGGTAWPAGIVWPATDDAATTTRIKDELWSIYREAKRPDASSKELGPLPPTLDKLMAAAKETKQGITPGSLTLGEHHMPFVVIRKETQPVPETGRALYICLHGGGQNDKADGPHAWDVNTREWQAQASLAAGLYAGEGVYFVPRMADDRLGRWWHAHVQDAVNRVIGHALREWNVDPNRVYLMGISEGAYGTQILGPFMADRFGGANAMAGGVGDDVPAENLRNLAFRTDVGEKDTMFDRIGLARKFHARMDAGAKEYGGFINHLEVQAGKGHGVDYRPGAEWMIRHHRDPRPDTVVWTAKPLDQRRRPAFYWLGLSGENLDGAIRLTGKIVRDDNRVDITALAADGSPLHGATVSVMLDEALLDLDKTVTVTCNGKTVTSTVPKRSVETLARTLTLRGDPAMAFPVTIETAL